MGAAIAGRINLAATSSTAKRHQRAHPRIAEPQAAPDEEAEIDAEQLMAEQRIADAHIGCDRPAEQGGLQDRAQYGRSRDQIERNADDLDHADEEVVLRRPAKAGHRLAHDPRREELEACRHEEERSNQAGKRPADEPTLRDQQEHRLAKFHPSANRFTEATKTMNTKTSIALVTTWAALALVSIQAAQPTTNPPGSPAATSTTELQPRLPLHWATAGVAYRYKRWYANLTVRNVLDEYAFRTGIRL